MTDLEIIRDQAAQIAELRRWHETARYESDTHKDMWTEAERTITMLRVQLEAAPPRGKPLDVDKLQERCLTDFLGGHKTPETIEAFQHGMMTVCNVLRGLTPSTLIDVPALIAWCRQHLADHVEAQRRVSCRMNPVPPTVRPETLVAILDGGPE